jgi:predicted lipid carrier protein YhbT
MLQKAADRMWDRHPGIFPRLEAHAGKVFLIDPTDLPFVFRLAPRPGRPVVEPCRREAMPAWDARIAGPLAALIGMIHGAYDGDAMFFSRDILIQGDPEAVLALRNALDDAEIDLPTEIAAACGPVGPAIARIAHGVLPVMSRLTGFNLMRWGGP